jgi:hypothetical protein
MNSRISKPDTDVGPHKAHRLFALVSTVSILTLGLAAAIDYVVELLNRQETNDAARVIITVLGLFGLLSGIAFNYAACLTGKQMELAVRAAERFLLGALMLLQTLVVRFTMDKTEAWEWIKNIHIISYPVYYAAMVIAHIFGLASILLALGGFRLLSELLTLRLAPIAEQKNPDPPQESTQAKRPAQAGQIVSDDKQIENS